MRSPAGRLATRTVKASDGVAANGSTCACVTSSVRSGTGGSHAVFGARVQGVEETIDRVPGVLDATESAPFGPDQPDQPITHVDGHDVVAARRRWPPADAVDEHRLDIRAE